MNTQHCSVSATASGFRCVLALLVCTGIVLSGCTSLQTVPLPVQPGNSVIVRVGDNIKAQTKNGVTHVFTVSEIQTDAFVGREVRVAHQDIAVLQVERIDKTRTTLLVAAIVVVVAGALVAGAASSSVSGVAFGPL